jgi:CHAT domain-containing protein
LFVNTNHKQSISRGRAKPQGQTARPAVSPLVTAALVVTGWSVSAAAGETSCSKALGALATPAVALKTLGTDPSEAELAVSPGHTYLIEVAERGNDALVELLDSKNQLIARADHPERRTGTRWAMVTAPSSGGISVRVSGKEHAQVAGTATVSVFDLAAITARADCLVIFKGLAQADADYAAGQEISRGRSTSPTASARDAFQRAADEYGKVERTLTAVGDRGLRGQTQLALAGAEYFDLQDWAKTVEWAEAASPTLAGDPYRRARGRALVAAAWIELGRLPAAQQDQAHASELLDRARADLRGLAAFHAKRGERYDAALQLTNISLTYLYESRFHECVTAAMTVSRLFGFIGESQRRAQAWHNAALCLWGLGRMPEALRLFERGLGDIGPEPYPNIYLSAINNTALANWALGRFDESLSLFDRALTFAQQVQADRAAAQSLYGIGVNYYALGDRDRAREFLERSLKVRTVDRDRRGRMASLRALATVDAEQGRLGDALAFDREALELAVGPSSTGRVKIQLAVHTAAAGRRDEALALLGEALAAGEGAEPVIQAEALLQRATLLREMGRPKDALRDLDTALPRLHQVGSVTEEFVADIELARSYRQLGLIPPAAAAVESALALADAVRGQTANPELRAQLQTPLRSAYDLRIELLRTRYEAALAAGRGNEAQLAAALAFSTADASRARTLADVAAQQYTPAARRTLAPELQRREALYRELAGRRFVLEARLDRFGSNDAAAKHLVDDIGELERQLDTVNTTIARRVPTQGALAQPAGPHRMPVVPYGTALVSYWLGNESAYAWVLTSTGIDWKRLATPALISARATAFHHSLARLVDVPRERRLENGRVLYELLIGPCEAELAGARQWVVIPDGALDYVPFAALRMSAGKVESFVVANHDVALTPAAWMLNTRQVPPRVQDRRELLLVADPVYEADDPRLAAARRVAAAGPTPGRGAIEPGPHGYQRLAFTAQEADGILAQFRPSAVDELIGLNATRDRLLSLDWSKYRFIHIATHGVVDAQVPELSALILGFYDAGGNQVESAVRVSDLSLRTLTADVATFSACDTALGKEVPSEGLVGIGSTVLARGARAVVASLWPVSDEIGAHLMTDFYRYLLHDSMSAPAALGAAMRSVVSRDESADPALWAAFQVSVIALGPGLPSRSAEPVNSSTITRP